MRAMIRELNRSPRPGRSSRSFRSVGDLAVGVMVQQTIHLGNDLGWGGPGLPGKLRLAHG